MNRRVRSSWRTTWELYALSRTTVSGCGRGAAWTPGYRRDALDEGEILRDFVDFRHSRDDVERVPFPPQSKGCLLPVFHWPTGHEPVASPLFPLARTREPYTRAGVEFVGCVQVSDQNLV